MTLLSIIKTPKTNGGWGGSSLIAARRTQAALEWMYVSICPYTFMALCLLKREAKLPLLRVISGFRHIVDESCVLLGCYAVLIDGVLYL
jgi:hypothetical protein